MESLHAKIFPGPDYGRFVIGDVCLLLAPRWIRLSNVPTFSKDIALILQRSCQKCHNDNGVAPMSLITYQDARPWARAIKQRTALRDKRGAMPPWFIEKTVGIQHYKNDVSLSEDEIAKIGKWADNGAPEEQLSDLPPTKVWDGQRCKWTLGQPDPIISTPEVTVTRGRARLLGRVDGCYDGLDGRSLGKVGRDPRSERH